jgi:hypothetical protein
VVINAGVTVTHLLATSESIHSLSSQDPVNFSNGSLTVANDLGMTGAALTLSGPAQLTTGTLTLQSGASVNAATSIAVGGLFSLDQSSQASLAGFSAGGLQLTNGASLSSSAGITVAGDVTVDLSTVDTTTLDVTNSALTSGPNNLIIQDSGSVTATGSVSVTGTTLVSNGSFTASSRLVSGYLTVQDNGLLTVTGTTTVQKDVTVGFPVGQSSAPDFSQASLSGLLGGGSLSVQSGASFSSSGDVNLQSGSVAVFLSSFTLTGGARLRAGGLFSQGGTFAFPSTVTVSGQVIVFGVDLSLTASLKAGELDLNGGSSLTTTSSVSVTGDATFADSPVHVGGRLTIGGGLTVEEGAVVSSPNPVVVGGLVLLEHPGTTFTAGLVAGNLTITQGAALTTAADVSVNNLTFLVGGNVALTGTNQLATGSLIVENGGKLTAPTGTHVQAISAATFLLGPTEVVSLNGTIQAGSTAIVGGTVHFGGPTQIFSLAVSGGAVVTLTPVNPAQAPGSAAVQTRVTALTAQGGSIVTLNSMVAAGLRFVFDGGATVIVNGSLPAISKLVVDGGRVTVNGNLTVAASGFLVLDSGTATVRGNLVLPASGILQVGDDTAASLASARLSVSGSANLAGTLLAEPGAGPVAAGQQFQVLSFGSQGSFFQSTVQSQPGLFSFVSTPQSLSLVGNSGSPTGAPVATLTTWTGQTISVFGLSVPRSKSVALPTTSTQTVNAIPEVATPARAGVLGPNTVAVAATRSSSGTSSGGDVGDPAAGLQAPAAAGSGADLVETTREARSFTPGQGAEHLVLPASADLFSEAQISRSLLLGTKTSSHFLPGGKGAAALAAALSGGDAAPKEVRAGQGADDDFPLADCLMGLGGKPWPAAAGANKAAARDGLREAVFDEFDGPGARPMLGKLGRELEVSVQVLVASLVGSTLFESNRRRLREKDFRPIQV